MHQSRHDADSYQRVEVITGRRRRRDWSDEEKAQILAESANPEVNISEVARRNGVSRGLLNIWRRKARLASSERPTAVRELHAPDWLGCLRAGLEAYRHPELAQGLDGCGNVAPVISR